MPPLGKTIASFSPLTYLTDLLEYFIQGTSYYPVALDITILLIFTVLFLATAIKLHERILSKRL
jgi:ABC-type multidrug transport system permease subunit